MLHRNIHCFYSIFVNFSFKGQTLHTHLLSGMTKTATSLSALTEKVNEMVFIILSIMQLSDRSFYGVASFCRVKSYYSIVDSVDLTRETENPQ